MSGFGLCGGGGLGTPVGWGTPGLCDGLTAVSAGYCFVSFPSSFLIVVIMPFKGGPQGRLEPEVHDPIVRCFGFWVLDAPRFDVPPKTFSPRLEIVAQC